MTNPNGINAGRQIRFVDLFHVVPKIIAFCCGGSRGGGVKAPGVKNGPVGCPDKAYVQVIYKPGLGGVKCVGRNGSCRICPNHRCLKGNLPVVVIGAFPHIAIGNRVTGVQTVTAFGNERMGNKVRSGAGIHQSPAGAIIGTLSGSKLVGGMQYQGFQCRGANGKARVQVTVMLQEQGQRAGHGGGGHRGAGIIIIGKITAGNGRKDIHPPGHDIGFDTSVVGRAPAGKIGHADDQKTTAGACLYSAYGQGIFSRAIRSDAIVAVRSAVRISRCETADPLIGSVFYPMLPAGSRSGVVAVVACRLYRQIKGSVKRDIIIIPGPAVV